MTKCLDNLLADGHPLVWLLVLSLIDLGIGEVVSSILKLLRFQRGDLGCMRQVLIDSWKDTLDIHAIESCQDMDVEILNHALFAEIIIVKHTSEVGLVHLHHS